MNSYSESLEAVKKCIEMSEASPEDKAFLSEIVPRLSPDMLEVFMWTLEYGSSDISDLVQKTRRLIMSQNDEEELQKAIAEDKKAIEEEQFLYQRDLSSLGQFTEENLWQSQKGLYEKVPDDIRLKLEEAYESEVRTFHDQLQTATEQVNMNKTGWLIRQIEARNKQFSHDKHNGMVENAVVPINESVIREKREEEWIELKHWKKVEEILTQYEKRIAKRNIAGMVLRTVFS